MTRSIRLEVFCKKGVLRNFAKFTGKHLCQSLFFNKVAGLRSTTLLKKGLWHKCFPVNFVKFLSTRTWKKRFLPPKIDKLTFAYVQTHNSFESSHRQNQDKYFTGIKYSYALRNILRVKETFSNLKKYMSEVSFERHSLSTKVLIRC